MIVEGFPQPELGSRQWRLQLDEPPDFQSWEVGQTSFPLKQVSGRQLPHGAQTA